MLDLKCFLYRSIYDFKKTTQNLKTQTTFYRFVMMISARFPAHGVTDTGVQTGLVFITVTVKNNNSQKQRGTTIRIITEGTS